MEKLKGKNDTVWILGTSESLIDTPWDRENEDYWACSPVLTQAIAKGHRLDAVFELHEERTWQNYKKTIDDFNKNNKDCIIYVQRIYPGFEYGTVYPIEKVQDSINNKLFKRYFTNTMVYMIALAIEYGYKKINLCGVNLIVEEEEYSMQRACAEAWLAYALGKGIEVEITQPSAIFSCPYMYGYEGHRDVMIKLIQRKEAAQLGLHELTNRMQQAREDYLEQSGAIKMLEVLKKEFRI